MLNIGPGELVIIFVAALVLLGPERLPELARGIGKFLREFRRQTDDVRGMVEREFYRMDEEIKAPLPGPVPLPPPTDVTLAGGTPYDPYAHEPLHTGPLPEPAPLPEAKPAPEVMPPPEVPLVLGFPEGTVSRARPVVLPAPAAPPAPAAEPARELPPRQDPGSEPHGG